MTHLSWILTSLAAAGGEGSELRIDPLLVAAVVEAYQGIARADNPVWPGWDASDTPVLLYLPGVQDVLLNHPKAPPGFRRAAAGLLPEGLLPAGWSVDVRDGETTFTLDGQNTSTTVNGIETLVVADPLSNVRPGLVQLLDDPRPTREKEPELSVARLTMDPYDELAMVVHEAFHVHQARRAPNKAASEAWLLAYPWLAAENNALFALEGECLARALGAADQDGAFEAGLEWLAVRAERRAKLPAQAVQYEDGTEFNEGLAKYVEWRASEAFEGKPAGPGLRWARGFRGFDGLGFWRAELLRQLASHSSGETIVNGDPYGSGGLRFRLYFTGMAIGVLLDRLGAEGWHARIFEGGTTLTGLAEEVLAPAAGERAEALARAKTHGKAPGGFAAVLARKKELEEAGLRAARAAAERILTGPALFTLDFSGVDAPLGLGFTPFGLTRVDAARTIYGQIPMRAELGAAASFQQASTAPILVDTQQKKLWFQLAAPVEAAELARLAKVATLGDAPLTGLELALPGVTLSAAKAVLRAQEGGVELVLVR